MDMKAIRRASRFLKKNPENLPRFSRDLVRPIQFIMNTWKEFVRDHGPIRASGLAYSTLLALVPLVVVVFSLFSAFGGLDNLITQIQSSLVKILIPTRQDEILKYINQFTSNARALGILGSLTFVITSVLLLSSIERNFNEVWGTHVDFGLLKRFSTYTTVLVVGSLLIGVSFALTAWINSFLQNLGISQLTTLVEFLIRLFPTLTILAAFMLMITQIPATSVQLGSAFLGSAVGAVLWELAKIGFSAWADSSVRNSVIYGSLALIPIFLLWLYVAWNIILFALEVSFVHQHIQKSATEDYLEIKSSSEQILLGLGVFLSISRPYNEGKDVPTLKDLSNEFLISPSDIDEVVHIFASHRLLLPLQEQRWGYVPGRSLDRIFIAEIIRILNGTLSPEMQKQFVCEPAALDLVNSFVRGGFETLHRITIADLIRIEPEATENTADCVDEVRDSE